MPFTNSKESGTYTPHFMEELIRLEALSFLSAPTPPRLPMRTTTTLSAPSLFSSGLSTLLVHNLPHLLLRLVQNPLG